MPSSRARQNQSARVGRRMLSGTAARIVIVILLRRRSLPGIRIVLLRRRILLRIVLRLLLVLRRAGGAVRIWDPVAVLIVRTAGARLRGGGRGVGKRRLGVARVVIVRFIRIAVGVRSAESEVQSAPTVIPAVGRDHI